jgi:hypothetical protein
LHERHALDGEPERHEVLVSETLADPAGLAGRGGDTVHVALHSGHERPHQAQISVLDALFLRSEELRCALHPGRGDASFGEVRVVIDQLKCNVCGATRLTLGEVGGERPLARGDAVSHLAHPPRGLGQQHEVVGRQTLLGIGPREQIQRFAPGVAAGCLTARFQRALGHPPRLCHTVGRGGASKTASGGLP